ncbi:hypothetical protein MSG28_001666 [Choristoneura fumiferana]|uniref:Uncharacterized protein n=2 Tax=Choristoneura fumiferana TaxID=7141 RepID=A0ACC0KVJ6_CHOFU|nr:hypothetical protein MSG28_001666 [Choristoneura fumiferana]
MLKQSNKYVYGKVWQSTAKARRDAVACFVRWTAELWTLEMSDVPEVVVETCNGVAEGQDPNVAAAVIEEPKPDEGLAIDPKLGCRVRFPSDVIRET